MGVIVCPAWETIAEQTLPRNQLLVLYPESRYARLCPKRVLTRSLAMLAYLNMGYIRRPTDSGL
ncbi:MAG: hypothetical protein GQ556_09890 [Desulfobacterales bacterium]|nr:hypothetical protein [Desulfobacterales bacterium]